MRLGEEWSARNPFPWTGGPPCQWQTSLERSGWSGPGTVRRELDACAPLRLTGAEELVTSVWWDYTSAYPHASREAEGLPSLAAPADRWYKDPGELLSCTYSGSSARVDYRQWLKLNTQDSDEDLCSGRRWGIRREEPEASPTSNEPAEGRTEILRLCSCWRSRSIRRRLNRPLSEAGADTEGVLRTGSALVTRRLEQESTTGGRSLPVTRERNVVHRAGGSHHFGSSRPRGGAAVADRLPMPPRHSASVPLPPRGPQGMPPPRRG
jgi:hypothetical protein